MNFVPPGRWSARGLESILPLTLQRMERGSMTDGLKLPALC
jgi:hypothetical protein